MYPLLSKYYKLEKEDKELQKIENWTDQDLKNYLNIKYEMDDIENILKDEYNILVFKNI